LGDTQTNTELFLHSVKQSSQAHHSFATTVSQLKISDFSGETFKGFEVL